MCSCPGTFKRIHSHHMIRHAEDGQWGEWVLRPTRSIEELDRVFGGRDNWDWQLLYAWESHEET